MHKSNMFFTCGVPYLKFDLLPVYFNDSGTKLDSDGMLNFKIP